MTGATNEYTLIDLETWPRREQFEHFRERVPTTFTMTVDIDVTELVRALEATSRRAYATQGWVLATIVNRHAEFRTTMTPDGRPATWPVVHPLFTVLNPERETFAGVWVPYSGDFADFHDVAVETLTTYRSATTLFPQPDVPPNIVEISSIPWVGFTSFNLQVTGAEQHLGPIITLGGYRHAAERTVLPMSMQFAHAATDGFHAARLFTEVQELMAAPDWIS